MPFEIVRNDITNMHVDAIVNTANPHPVIGSGTDTAIHEKAGPQLLQARKKIGEIPMGSAAITPAFDLPAKYVIHAVGPAWYDGQHNEEQILRSAYDNALRLARKKHCQSVAFPLMSSGNYGFPKDRALTVAIGAFSDFLMEHKMQIYLVVFNKEAFSLSQQLMDNVKSYIDEHYIEEKTAKEYRENRRRRWELENELFEETVQFQMRETYNAAPSCTFALSQSAPAPKSLKERLNERSETFTQTLRRIMMEQDLSGPDVYKRVFMDKKTFNKIINDTQHQPSKRSALQLAIALRLNLDEARDFIAKAGYAFNPSNRFDVVLSYMIENKNYNIIEIDAVLFEFTETTLSNCG